MSKPSALNLLNSAVSERLNNSSKARIDNIENEISKISSNVTGLNTSFSASTNAFQSQIDSLKKKINELEPRDIDVMISEYDGDIVQAVSDLRVTTTRDLNELKLNVTKQIANTDQLGKRINSSDTTLRSIIVDIEQKLNDRISLLNQDEELELFRTRISNIESKNTSDSNILFSQSTELTNEVNTLKSMVTNLITNSEKLNTIEEILMKLQSKVASMGDISSKTSELTVKVASLSSILDNTTKRMNIVSDSVNSNSETLSQISIISNQTDKLLSEYSNLKSQISSYSHLEDKVSSLSSLINKISTNLKDVSDRISSFEENHNVSMNTITTKVNNIKTNFSNQSVSNELSPQNYQDIIARLLNAETNLSLLKTKVIETKNTDTTSSSNTDETVKTDIENEISLLKDSILNVKTKVDDIINSYEEKKSSFEANVASSNVVVNHNVLSNEFMIKEEHGKFTFSNEANSSSVSIQPGWNSISNKTDSKASSISTDKSSSFIFPNQITALSIKAMGDIEGYNCKLESVDITGDINIKGTINGLNQMVLSREPLMKQTVQLEQSKLTRIKSEYPVNMIRVLHSGWNVPATVDTYIWRYESEHVEIQCGNKIHTGPHQVLFY